jgi:hypothetical protein
MSVWKEEAENPAWKILTRQSRWLKSEYRERIKPEMIKKELKPLPPSSSFELINQQRLTYCLFFQFPKYVVTFDEYLSFSISSPRGATNADQ